MHFYHGGRKQQRHRTTLRFFPIVRCSTKQGSGGEVMELAFTVILDATRMRLRHFAQY